MKSGLWLAATLAALVGSQVVLGKHLRSLDTAWVEPPSTPEARWNPRLFTFLTFGHLPAAVDWLWIRVMTDSAIARVSAGVHPAMYYHLDLATDLDPALFEAYEYGASLLAVIRDDKAGARDLLTKGVRFIEHDLPGYPASFRDRFWNRSWSIHMVLAYVWLFEFDDLPRAGEEFRKAGEIPGAPVHARRMAERLSRPGGVYEVGVKLLTFMITSLGDQHVKVQRELERKRESLYLSQYLFQLTDSFREWLGRKPEYRSSTRLTPEAMHRYWKKFASEANVPAVDPWGGRISIDGLGKVVSTTPRIKVLGLD